MNTADVEMDAFSSDKKVVKANPQQWLKRGTGTGGTAPTESRNTYESAVAAAASDAIVTKPARIKKATQVRANPPNTEFRKFYERGDLPIQIDHRGVKNALLWKVDIDQLDYHHYLPIFFSGLREFEEPYAFMAEQGCIDLLRQGGSQKVLPVIPQLIIPLKDALNTRASNIEDGCIVQKTIKMIQQLLTLEDNGTNTSETLIGMALVPYYRQILPIFNTFSNDRENMGHEIAYQQQAALCLGDLIENTLQYMEIQGGADAFINIKYIIPTYQSVLSGQ